MSALQQLGNAELGSKSWTPRHRKAWDQYLDGYPLFSAFLTDDPDKSNMIFRRFDRTSARNLLYLENELSVLERKLDVSEDEKNADGATRAGARNWEALQESAHQNTPKAVEIQELVLKIREKTKEYQKALVLYNQVLSFTAPERRALKANRHVLAKSCGWKYRQDMLIDDNLGHHLNEENEEDLCALKALPKPDRLTRLFEGKLAFLFREKIDGKYADYVRHQHVERTVSAISSIMAALFLIGAVLGLYFVDSQRARLGMLCGFTIGFAGSLAMLTNAGRHEVFAATAAYAAVLVVFLSGDFAQNSASPSGSSAGVATVTLTTVILASATATG